MAETAGHTLRGGNGGQDTEMASPKRHGGSPKSPGVPQAEGSFSKPQTRANNEGAGRSKDEAQGGAGAEKHRQYKVARFCNSMKVYKKFCSMTGAPVQPKLDLVYSDHAENSDHVMYKGVDKNKQAMGFRQYSMRKDISEGEYSAHELRFLDVQRSSFRIDNRRA